jgi:hypothetical protein
LSFDPSFGVALAGKRPTRLKWGSYWQLLPPPDATQLLG